MKYNLITFMIWETEVNNIFNRTLDPIEVMERKENV